MDSELRRRFLQLLGFDLAKVDLRDEDFLPNAELSGPKGWLKVRNWWVARLDTKEQRDG